MKIAVLVNGSPTQSRAAQSALAYCRAAIKLGHRITRVFFYGDAVHCGNALIAPPQDESDLCRDWQTLQKDHDLELILCIAAALRRGVLNEQEAKRHARPAANMAEGFTLSGLGQLVDMTIHCDRLITFGGSDG